MNWKEFNNSFIRVGEKLQCCGLLLEEGFIPSIQIYQEFEKDGFLKKDVHAALQEIKDLSSSELICRALESEDPYDTVARCELERRGSSETFALAKQLIEKTNSRERRLGVIILTHKAGKNNREEAEALLKILFEHEVSSDVLIALANGLYQLDLDNRAEILEKHAENSDPTVREAIAFSLSLLSDPKSISIQLKYARDPVVKVRNWASFSLAQCEKDSDEIRNALRQLVTDEDRDVKGEALLGLAKRKDESSKKLIADELQAKNVNAFAVRAASEWKDSSFIPYLVELKKRVDSEEIDSAILECSSN